MKIRLTLVAVVAMSLFATSGCYWVNQNGVPDPGAVLHHDYSFSGNCGSWCGQLMSCYYINGGSNGGQSICRVVDGAEQVGDNRNWDVSVSCGWIGNWCYWDDTEVHADGIFDPGAYYGVSIRTGGGEMYEGCRFRYDDPDPNTGRATAAVFWCDTRIRNEFLLITDGGYRWFFGALWHWADYIATDVIGCDAALWSVQLGAPMTLAVLAACKAGPM
jgi:hypothetical protein